MFDAVGVALKLDGAACRFFTMGGANVYFQCTKPHLLYGLCVSNALFQTAKDQAGNDVTVPALGLMIEFVQLGHPVLESSLYKARATEQTGVRRDFSPHLLLAQAVNQRVIGLVQLCLGGCRLVD